MFDDFHLQTLIKFRHNNNNNNNNNTTRQSNPLGWVENLIWVIELATKPIQKYGLGWECLPTQPIYTRTRLNLMDTNTSSRDIFANALLSATPSSPAILIALLTFMR